MKVGDVMSEEILTIAADAPLKEAAMIMVKGGVSGLPVVEDDRKVVGIITEADFVTAEANRSWGRQRRRLLSNFLGDTKPRNAKTVADVMTANPHMIDSAASVTEAARIMTDLRVKRLPVVLSDGTLCGIISRADVMGVFTRPDDALADEIANGVAIDVLGLSPGDISVTVEDGVAQISGQVPSRSQSRILEELATRVEGVVAVESSVTWTHDDARPGTSTGP
jgi:CBS domain-containing protein